MTTSVEGGRRERTLAADVTLGGGEMGMRGWLAAVVVVSLELFSTRVARAEAGADVIQGGPARRAKPMRLDLTLAWPAPAGPPLIPPAGGPAVPTAAAPAPSAPQANGAQVTAAILMTIIADTTGIFVALHTQSI